MNFVTSSFVLFFLPVLFIGWALRGHVSLYRLFLLGAGLFFYACAGPLYLLLLLAVAVLNWGTVRLMTAAARYAKWWVGLDVAVHIGLLAFFKYYEFLTTSIMDAVGFCGGDASFLFSEKIAELAFPVGLSFYTFQGLSYTIDHYRNPQSAPRSLMDVLCYVSFFPTIMAGPIMRENDFFPQLAGTPTADCNSHFREGTALILSGLFKKLVLASYLSVHVVDPIFTSPENFGHWAVLAAIYGYTIQIYCDFSGYTDLALGIGRLMGFKLPPNFDSPYLSLNLQEFWRRWHISLSTWLRDYLYIPLGGSRRGSRYVNLTLTMLIGGLWHGSGFTFLLWGLLHGLLLAVVHAFHQLRKKLGWLPAEGAKGVPGKIVAWLLTLHVVAVLWVFFRADSVDTALCVLGRAVDIQAVGEGFSLLLIPAVIAGLLIQVVGPHVYRRYVALPVPTWVYALLSGLAAGLLFNMGPDGVLPFIYFNF